MRASPRDWQTSLACPACGEESLVSASAMQSVLRCPHCRKILGIGTGGITQVIKHAWRPGGVSPTSSVHHHGPLRKSTAAKNSQAPAHPGLIKLIAVVSVAVVVVGGLGTWLATLPLFSTAARNVDRDSQEIEQRADAFLLAWLSDDLESGATFVMADDLPFLQNWWKASRAGAATTSSKKLTGKPLRVEVSRVTADRCSVRLSFKVAGREQYVLHDWKRDAGEWKIDFGSHLKLLD